MLFPVGVFVPFILRLRYLSIFLHLCEESGWEGGSGVEGLGIGGRVRGGIGGEDGDRGTHRLD